MIRNIAALAAVVALFLSVAGCSRHGAEDKRLRVVVTILPLAEFVERVGGEKVRVAVMVPPGASPHTYEPRPSQLKEVSKADLFVKVGSRIEFELVWMDKIIDVNRRMPVVDSSEGVELIRAKEGHEEEHEEDGAEGRHHSVVDPHIWLSPKNAKKMVDNVFKGLAKADPANISYYEKNRDAYLSEIDALDGYITKTLSKAKSRKVMVYHSAWAYLARDYGIEEISIEKGGKQASPAGIAVVIRQARENDIRVIFASPEFSTRSAEVIAKEIGGQVVMVSPYARPYIENFKKVVAAFAER